jgi:hypothetical protein
MCGNDGTGQGYLTITGQLTKSTVPMEAPGFNNISDKRLKTNIQPLPSVLSSIKELNPVTYNNINSSTIKKIGLVAQELEKVFPEFVHTDSSPEKMKSVSYSELTAVLIKAIQEQQVMIESMKKDIAKLKSMS